MSRKNTLQLLHRQSHPCEDSSEWQAEFFRNHRKSLVFVDSTANDVSLIFRQVADRFPNRFNRFVLNQS